MKKFFAVLLAVLFMSTVAIAAPGNYSAPDEPGDIVAKHGTMATPDRTFRLVRYQPPSKVDASVCASLTKDSIVIWDSTSADGVTITYTSTSGDCRVAGIAAVTFLTPEYYGRTASNDLGGRNWGWIQTYGLCNMRVGSKGTAANKAIGTGSVVGCIVTMDSEADGTAHEQTPANWTTAGFIMQKQETAGISAVGFIRCQ